MELFNKNEIFQNMPSPFNRKTKDWAEKTLNYLSKHLFTSNDILRAHKKVINENYNLYIGVLSETRLNAANNPLELDGEKTRLKRSFIDDTVIVTPMVDTLVGEEKRRGNSWTVTVTNPEAITKKEMLLRDKLIDKAKNLLDPNISDEEAEQQLNDILDWKDYEFQDIREMRVKQLLNHYYELHRMAEMFNEGFKDLLIAAEETYIIEIINNEPVIERVDPLTLEVHMTSDSNDIEDAEVIKRHRKMTPTAIMTKWGTLLKKHQVDKIFGLGGQENTTTNPLGRPGVVFNEEVFNQGGMWLENDFDDESNYVYPGHSTGRTSNNEIAVCEIYWRTMKGLKVLKYLDPITGEDVEELLDESVQYTPDPNLGETITKLYVTEWWQGVEIYDDILVDIKPCPVQFRSVNDIYDSKPPFAGMIYNVNDRHAHSLVDMLKPLQYRWAIYNRKIDTLITRNKGMLLGLDINRIPIFGKGEDVDKSLDKFWDWVDTQGTILQDATREGANGEAIGQFVGSALQAVDASNIRDIMNLLQVRNDIMMQAEVLCGVNEQRRGQGSASEGLGVQENRIVRSTHQTEKYFSRHELIKVRALEKFIEVTKHTIKNGNKRIPFILDERTSDLSNVFDGSITDEIMESDFGIQFVPTHEIEALDNDVKLFTEYAMNTGSVTLADIISIKESKSIRDKVVKLKRAERKKKEREDEIAKQQQAQQEALLQKQEEAAELQFQRELLKMQKEFEYKMQLEQLKISAGAYQAFAKSMEDSNNNSIDDNVEIKKQELINEDKEKQRKFEAAQAEKDRSLEEVLVKYKVNNTKTSKK